MEVKITFIAEIADITDVDDAWGLIEMDSEELNIEWQRMYSIK